MLRNTEPSSVPSGATLSFDIRHTQRQQHLLQRRQRFPGVGLPPPPLSWFTVLLLLLLLTVVTGGWNVIPANAGTSSCFRPSPVYFLYLIQCMNIFYKQLISFYFPFLQRFFVIIAI